MRTKPLPIIPHDGLLQICQLVAAVAPVRFEQQLRERLTSELKQRTSRTTLDASPRVRDRFLAASVFWLKGSGAADNPLLALSRAAL